MSQFLHQNCDTFLVFEHEVNRLQLSLFSIKPWTWGVFPTCHIPQHTLCPSLTITDFAAPQQTKAPLANQKKGSFKKGDLWWNDLSATGSAEWPRKCRFRMNADVLNHSTLLYFQPRKKKTECQISINSSGLTVLHSGGGGGGLDGHVFVSAWLHQVSELDEVETFKDKNKNLNPAGCKSSRPNANKIVFYNIKNVFRIYLLNL